MHFLKSVGTRGRGFWGCGKPKFQLLIEVLGHFFRVSMRGWFLAFLKNRSVLQVLIIGVQNKRVWLKKLCTLALCFGKGAFFCRARLQCFFALCEKHPGGLSHFFNEKTKIQSPVEIISRCFSACGPG